MINLEEEFSPRVNPADANYPFGSIKDNTSPGANDGTPLSAVWGNDWEGFAQAAMTEAGITPSGLPDTAQDSQLLDAVKVVASGALRSALLAPGGVNLVGNADAYYSTLSELVSQTWLKEGMVISTGGYATVNDGGSGRYHITSSGPAADGFINKNIGAGPLKAFLIHDGGVDPRQAGAIPGASDSSAAMQAIVNAGLAVVGANNSYTIVNSLLIKNDGVIRGKNKSSFKLVQGSNQPIIKLDSTAGPLQNCVVENISFIPNGFVGPAIEFVGTNPNDWHIFKNLKMKGATGAGFHRSIKCTGRMIWNAFENIEITGDRDVGFYVVSAGAVNLNSFTNVRSAFCQGGGFHFESTSGDYFKTLNFVTCNSEANGKDLARADVAGFYFSNVGETVLNACYVEDNGVGLADSSALRITGTFGGASVVGGLYWGSAYGINNTANLSWGSYEGYRASGTVNTVHVKNLNADSRVRLGVAYGDTSTLIEKDVNSDTRAISTFVNAQSISAEASAITNVRGKSFLHYLNGSPVTLNAASLADGILGQRVLIMGAGAALTIVHSTGLVLKTGADTVLTGGKSMEIIKISDTVWVQIT